MPGNDGKVEAGWQTCLVAAEKLSHQPFHPVPDNSVTDAPADRNTEAAFVAIVFQGINKKMGRVNLPSHLLATNEFRPLAQTQPGRKSLVELHASPVVPTTSSEWLPKEPCGRGRDGDG